MEINVMEEKIPERSAPNRQIMITKHNIEFGMFINLYLLQRDRR